MDFKISNTATGQKEKVFAEDSKTLRFYCCGPTVYGPAHIGNFRAFVVQDVFRRTAEVLGMETCHVRNITDFDDKTIRRSQEVGQSLVEFTNFWRKRFREDCDALNTLPPHIEPSALEHIPEQIKLIQTLQEKGLAYQANDDSVYYRISAFPRYGQLSGLKKEDQLKNADGRLNTSDEYGKETVADFALWKAWKPEDGPNKWDSPWGPGRPGWHIECSAMSMKYLGESYDLHSGGVDLVFPHHENEIAQSEGSTDKPFVRHWFHIAHLQVEGSKMSKSLGNLYTLEDVEKKGYDAETLRYVLLSGHYRQPLNFTWDTLSSAKSALAKLRKLKKKWNAKVRPHVFKQHPSLSPAMEALADDLNVPKALGKLFSALPELERLEGPEQSEAQHAFEAILFALGFYLDEQESSEDSIQIPQEVQDLKIVF